MVAETHSSAGRDARAAAGGETLAAKAATLVLVGGNSFAVLAQVAILPVISTLTLHFAGQMQDGSVLTLFGSPIGPELASQLMITLLGIGIMAGGPIMGFLAERIGNARLLQLSLALFGGSGLGCFVFDHASALLVLRFILGIAVAGISISCYALTGARFEGEARARMLGYQSALVTIVGVLSLVGAGYLADFAGWRAPFGLFLIAFPMFVVAAVAAWPKDASQLTSSARPSFRDLRPLAPF